MVASECDVASQRSARETMRVSVGVPGPLFPFATYLQAASGRARLGRGNSSHSCSRSARGLLATRPSKPRALAALRGVNAAVGLLAGLCRPVWMAVGVPGGRCCPCDRRLPAAVSKARAAAVHRHRVSLRGVPYALAELRARRAWHVALPRARSRRPAAEPDRAAAWHRGYCLRRRLNVQLSRPADR
jgi:hypothetical protein